MLPSKMGLMFVKSGERSSSMNLQIASWSLFCHTVKGSNEELSTRQPTEGIKNAERSGEN